MMNAFNHSVAIIGLMLADHLWQSTILVLPAAWIVWSLRKNPARFRFGIWLAASIKFLIPLAWLAHFGRLLGPKRFSVEQPSFSFAMEFVSQPFGHVPFAAAQSGRDVFLGMLPALLAVVWATGFVATLTTWLVRWFQVLDAKRRATPLNQGREVELLRVLESAFGLPPLPILVSPSHLEPGVFGISKPVLLWPSGISRELDEAQLRAILAHELFHVLRRDNLAAALQMLVAALFWFHPLVWWLGARQIEERERACDEGVLELGTEPSVYAESILKTCKFCVESPMPCVAGVNGSNLKQRIVRIMTHHETSTLSLTRKLTLASLATAVVAIPLFVGMANSSRVQAQSSSPDSSPAVLKIVSLKPNHSGPERMTLLRHTPEGNSLTNITAKSLIEMAYGLKDNQLTGGPDWIDQDAFDIVFTGGPASVPVNAGTSAALKEILAERFHLVIRQETRQGPVFALVVGNSGPKFSKVTPGLAPGTNEPLLSIQTMIKDGAGQISITGGPDGLADTLSSQVGRPIVDQTGLTGIYQISFHWATNGASSDSISSALQQQLGLDLVPREAPVQSSIVESIDLPTEG